MDVDPNVRQAAIDQMVAFFKTVFENNGLSADPAQVQKAAEQQVDAAIAAMPGSAS